jgi:hypothetical protein
MRLTFDMCAWPFETLETRFKESDMLKWKLTAILRLVFGVAGIGWG